MKDGQPAGKSKAAKEREERLKQALRNNLRRRKQAAKAAGDRQSRPAGTASRAPPDSRE